MTGKQIRRYRFSKGYETIKAFAEAVGYSEIYCQKLETEYKGCKPSPKFMEQLQQLKDLT